MEREDKGDAFLAAVRLSLSHTYQSHSSAVCCLRQWAGELLKMRERENEGCSDQLGLRQAAVNSMHLAVRLQLIGSYVFCFARARRVAEFGNQGSSNVAAFGIQGLRRPGVLRSSHGSLQVRLLALWHRSVGDTAQGSIHSPATE